MAQANSVQREPSMEEILASIRKIIEDSDGARNLTDAQESRFAARSEAAQATPSEVDTFRADLSYREEAAAPVSEPPSEAFQREAASPSVLRRFSQTEDKAADDDTFSDLYLEESDLAPEAPREPQAMIEDVPTTPASLPAEETRNILSRDTERQIAQSFGELSEAFLASRRKSFDEMAEDMLRPMLQDWLDNNLPLMVERLVREEIERIARGVGG